MSSGSQAQIAASQAATEAQAEAARNALAFSKEQFAAMQALRKPYTDAGASATQMLVNLLGIGPTGTKNGPPGESGTKTGGVLTPGSSGTGGGGTGGGGTSGGGTSGGGTSGGTGGGQTNTNTNTAHPPLTTEGEGWSGPGYYDLDGNWHDGYPTGPGVVYGNVFFPAGSPQLDAINRQRAATQNQRHTFGDQSQQSSQQSSTGLPGKFDTFGTTNPATSGMPPSTGDFGMVNVTSQDGKTFQVPSNLASLYQMKGFKV